MDFVLQQRTRAQVPMVNLLRTSAVKHSFQHLAAGVCILGHFCHFYKYNKTVGPLASTRMARGFRVSKLLYTISRD